VLLNPPPITVCLRAPFDNLHQLSLLQISPPAPPPKHRLIGECLLHLVIIHLFSCFYKASSVQPLSPTSFIFSTHSLSLHYHQQQSTPPAYAHHILVCKFSVRYFMKLFNLAYRHFMWQARSIRCLWRCSKPTTKFSSSQLTLQQHLHAYHFIHTISYISILPCSKFSFRH
jgi:hypothetical protein